MCTIHTEFDSTSIRQWNALNRWPTIYKVASNCRYSSLVPQVWLIPKVWHLDERLLDALDRSSWLEASNFWLKHVCNQIVSRFRIWHPLNRRVSKQIAANIYSSNMVEQACSSNKREHAIRPSVEQNDKISTAGTQNALMHFHSISIAIEPSKCMSRASNWDREKWKTTCRNPTGRRSSRNRAEMGAGVARIS